MRLITVGLLAHCLVMVQDVRAEVISFDIGSSNPVTTGGLTLTTTTVGGAFRLCPKEGSVECGFTGFGLIIAQHDEESGYASATYQFEFSKGVNSVAIGLSIFGGTLSNFRSDTGAVSIQCTDFHGDVDVDDGTIDNLDLFFGSGRCTFSGPSFRKLYIQYNPSQDLGGFFYLRSIDANTDDGAANDRVSLALQGAQTALWVNGRVGGQQWVYKTITPTGTDPIDLGVNVQLSDKDFGNQIVAFSEGRPPTLVPNVAWSDQSDTPPVAFRPSSEIEIKVWIVSGNKTRTQVQEEINYAARVWRKERLGFVLKNGGITDVRAKMVGAPSKPAAQAFATFSCNDLAKVTGAILPPGPVAPVIHVLYVGTIPAKKKGSTVLGRVCEIGGQYTAIAEKAPVDTLAHELGHNMSLLHTCVGAPNGCVTPRKALPNFDLSNVMMQYSKNVQRKYLTEGQTFRMNFDTDSALETVYGVPGAGARTCEKLQAVDTADCPALHKRIWSDGKLGASP